MSQNLTVKGILLEKLNRVLNPNFDVKFIWALLSGGVLFVGYQRVIQLCSSLEVLSGSTYVKLSLSSAADTVSIIIGGMMIFSSIFIFIWRFSNSQPKAMKKYKSLEKAAKDIRPFMDDNRRIFTAFGPNSESGNTDELRQDYEVWEQLKTEQVVPNNDEILSILSRIKNFEHSEISIVNQMKSHISAFKKHCSDPSFDYSQHQFPPSFADLIFSYAKKGSNNICKYSDWLKNCLADSLDEVESVYIFGSALYGQEITDVDVIIKNNLSNIDQIRNFADACKKLKFSFKNDFQKSLHLKVFSNLEVESFNSFLEKIYVSERVI